MILGIMQPYFFPYIGYFDHIYRCDKWVVFDITQYTTRSWMNRNRVLHPVSGWGYITCNVKKTHQRSPIYEATLLSPDETYKELIGKLSHYKKKAPYYWNVLKVIEEIFDTIQNASLVHLNVIALKCVCEYLGISFKPIIASEQDYALPPIAHPGQWALEIAGLENADLYINPPGGKNLFVPQEFRDRKIGLAFTSVPEVSYSTPGYDFIPNLSILDVMMWNSPQEIKAQLGKAPLERVI